jgi:hypothetical protein
LKSRLFDKDKTKASAIDLDRWLEKPGMPEDAPVYHSTALHKVDIEIARFQQGAKPTELATAGWVTQQWQHFIQSLPDDISNERMVELDDAFHFTQTKNSEVLCDWLVLAIKRRYVAADDRLAQFLMDVGRRKFLKPLYTELAKTEDGLTRARAIYQRARPRYHAVSTATIDKILKWPGS